MLLAGYNEDPCLVKQILLESAMIKIFRSSLVYFYNHTPRKCLGS